MKFLFKVFMALFLIIPAATAYYAYTQYEAFQTTELSSDIDSFEIKKGSSIRTVANNLQNKNILNKTGLIEPKYFLLGLAKLTNQERSIKAGEYSLTKGMKPSDLLNLFSSGKTIQYKTRIPEGFKFSQIIEIIRKDENLKQTLSDDDYKNIMAKLDTKYQHHQAEGWFLPDTYSYPRNTTDLQFLQRSHDAMLKLLDEHWKSRQKFKGINTPYDALILASIIEKETGAPEDRTKVARVFINRLNIDMLLQTDPTVIYGMGDSYKGNIRKKDLRKDTPYNTYTRKGLTPTPISIPSKAAIDAAFNPADGDMLFFVAKGDGYSYFSKTYSEHKKAVIKFILNGKANKYQGDK